MTQPTPEQTPQPADDLYALKTTALDGKPADLSQFKGRVTLVVNVASECGYTPQYKGLQELHEQMKDRGFAVLGFPSNEFGGQEPGSPEAIRNFCTTKYGVTFPMFAKLETKPGAGQSPIYATLGKATGNLPNWNFCKYLVGKDGRVVKFYPSKVAPDDAALVKDIETALGS
ncbi:MAG: glutathione peroxidase [Planctomycetes bacterium]|nr:glutathione peroxidase [Planctomycetota bacterium]